MGKIPPAFRRAAAQSPVSTLLKANTSALQEQIPSPVSDLQPQKRTSQKKPIRKNGSATTNSTAKTSVPSIVFESANLSDAKSLFNSLVSSTKNAPSDPSFYNSILQSFSSVSSLQDSIFFLNHMIKKHPPFCPNRFTYHILLTQSCSLPDEQSLSDVHRVLNLMTTSGFPPIKFRQMLHQEQVNSTVNCFIKDMKDFGIKPDLVTYTIMIDNVCNSKNLREAMRLLGVLSEEGYKPDCYVYNTIMKGYCRLREAKKFLGVMAEKGYIPDAVTYTSLMNGMCREGDALGALALLDEMEAKECSPNSCTYNTLLLGLCKARLLDKELSCIRKGRVAEAYEVFDYAVESKSLPDVAAYSTLESTLKWLQRAREQGLAV
ncbi:UNVERIFIED_CONTAM: Pentatricopeptide repeat-containing protein [Sesamum calycinum]|uniref:Pentatricopeptide repeat-containing protein n=1 Tax=Sesamum calycinum TaxID=2727403 RepID=A0AAW2P6N1_9LAMI